MSTRVSREAVEEQLDEYKKLTNEQLIMRGLIELLVSSESYAWNASKQAVANLMSDRSTPKAPNTKADR